MDASLKDRIEVVEGDITKLSVDAVVNAANTSLLGGGGVDGAIHRAAGPGLVQECRMLNGCRPGEAKLTGGHRLPARWVIHTVGPVYSTSADRSAILASCYRSALKVADHLGARSVAFPAISAGIYRWPIDDAARIAIGTVKSSDTKVQDIRFVLFGPEAYAAFSQHL